MEPSPPATGRSLSWSVRQVTPGLKLRLIQTHDPHKQWWTLEETRFCTRCDRLFVGRDIRVLEDGRGGLRFRCPTERCEGDFADWQYPRLFL